MKIILAPDSYKGTLTAAQVCAIMERGIRAELPGASFDAVPMADGGEGTLDAVVAAAGGRLRGAAVSGPLGAAISARYGTIRQGEEDWAVIETAEVVGLPMLKPEERGPLRTTSRGLGETMLAALDAGYRRIVIGLGGSSTNDGGMGMLAALGMRFLDGCGEELTGFGEDLAAVETIDPSGLDPRLAACALVAASDVANPLLGAEGATRVYGPQKGADADAVERLELAMARYADRMAAIAPPGLAESPGAGAAGGLGFAMLALGAAIEPGAAVVARLCGLAERIRRGDCVVTGEGCSDAQTKYGKLPLHVAGCASAEGKPVYLLSGSLGEGWTELLPHFSACLSTVMRPSTSEAALAQAESNLYEASRNLGRLLGAGGR
ncbi:MULTISPECIES: glycerate kinase [unclassified Paenibacillus]|uniref:glycerate kinase n=1 Tax=unclassified Paenibacillus TaxID=185978 RepID=UPI000955DD29|nr:MULTISPECIES: glycerate kinase [unclassified Paenibacillus]ASS67777.2 glycerate kinase [Paenibacillus sp. RUD330]SIR60969.1 glycerate kinase [Paenibacillus sp. RU4X]SIR69661.1 glycerate kinase [Paenibacillus sp. RU4T]